MIRARTTITYPFGTSIHPLPTRQGGAVLLVSLIMLTILTLLGVTAMTTTSLEEKMAANIQEASRALQVAETGIILAFDDSNTWNIDGYSPATPPSQVISDDTGTVTATATYTSSFNGWGNVPLESNYSSKSFRSAHFDFRITGDRGSVGTVIHGGAYLLAPKL